MHILDYIRRSSERYARQPAIITRHPHGAETTITYAELYRRMLATEPLPIPLLGKSWDGDFILHTTGTTGTQKHVIISQRAVVENSLNLIEAHGYSHLTRFIICGPMDHLGCWSKLFPTLFCGGTLYILTEQLKDTSAFFSAITPHTATFLVPSSLRILLQQSAHRLAQAEPYIDFIESGGAPLSHADMQHLCSLLPHSRLFNTYASTETGVIATYNYNDGRCLAGCLGRPIRHSRVFITAEGTIACQGPTLMSGYKDAPHLTASVMPGDTFFSADGGFIDSEGMLHIEGRRDDIINVGALKVSPSEVEDAALSHPSVADCICVASPHPILGEAPKLLVVLAPDAILNKRDLALHISRSLERYKVPLFYEAVSSIRRTPNGKPDRKAYREDR